MSQNGGAQEVNFATVHAAVKIGMRTESKDTDKITNKPWEKGVSTNMSGLNVNTAGRIEDQAHGHHHFQTTQMIKKSQKKKKLKATQKQNADNNSQAAHPLRLSVA